ncbi:hypothetical protein WMY93_017936 [Mugilogobius chulae]|uniref:Uncharacterized protein n=1 Tax=Mugilogobius chulae TaxID=88201 RepID=A0AAW0NMC6_9GOBI
MSLNHLSLNTPCPCTTCQRTMNVLNAPPVPERTTNVPEPPVPEAPPISLNAPPPVPEHTMNVPERTTNVPDHLSLNAPPMSRNALSPVPERTPISLNDHQCP